MAKFDKYLMSQLMVLFGFFSLVLVMIYWINRAVVLFDQLIANGHSALVFLEFSALTMPNVIRLVLPISAFAASLYCANRLAADSELVVVQSTGYSPFRLARPVLVFGVIVGLMLSVLSHFLVPASLTQLKFRQSEITANASSRLLREGTFFHPANGITFYISEIDADGTLQNVFLDDQRVQNQKTTYTARSAKIVTAQETTLLVMSNGLAQHIRLPEQTLTSTRFGQFVFDLGPLLAVAGVGTKHPREMSTSELLWPNAGPAGNRAPASAIMLREAHGRFAQALFCVVSALIGFSAILMGGFSRFSLWKQVVIAIVMLVVIKVVDNVLNDLAGQDARLWPMIYASSVLGLTISGAMLWLSARPSIFARRVKTVTP